MSTCPCCEGSSEPVFQKTVLGKHLATYARCKVCHSLHVVDPHWLDEAYRIADRKAADGGRVSRARAVAITMISLREAGVFPDGGRWLDYGAGDGQLGVLLDSQGYCTCSFDEYVSAISAEPEGKFVGCSLVEVIEHLSAPREVLAHIGRLTDLVLMTVEPYREYGPEWSYLATNWGQHITFPSEDGLDACAAAGGFKFRTSFAVADFPLRIHVLSKVKLPMNNFRAPQMRVAPKEVTLYNHYHAGDIAMSRTIIREIVAANPSVKISLECHGKHAYLWSDLGLPIGEPEEGSLSGYSINLHFACFGDSLKDGLTYQNNVDTYNKQAVALGMKTIKHDGRQRFVELSRPNIEAVLQPSVLVENGAVLSGQPVFYIDQALLELCDRFPVVTFYHSGKLATSRDNLVDVSLWDLTQLAVLSEQCQVLVCRLSAVMVASFTKANHGRRRVVFGEPIGCPIWDEDGVVYVSTFDELVAEIKRGTEHGES